MEQTFSLNRHVPLQRISFTLFILCLMGQAFATVRYVKPTASGSGDGSSWANASAGLQAMIDASGSGDEVWVAAGIYKPTSGTDRTISFIMKNGVAIYGGFPNTGDPGFGDRNWAVNLTTLSGDIGAAGNGDNSFRVISNDNNGLDDSALLDGFIVTGGNGTSGGGMYNASSSPSVTNCIFSGNAATSGGGMYNSSSSPGIINCAFVGNMAGSSGSGVYNISSSSPTITNCSFSGNLTNNSNGGVLYNQASSPGLTNCILWGNNTAIFNTPGSFPIVSYSIVQGGYAGAGNLNLDPIFVSQPPMGLGTAADLHLQPSSPAIDAGTASGAPAFDFDGELRPQGAGIDMGFDESGAYGCAPGNVLYVKENATGTNTGDSWVNAFTSLQDALAETALCPGVTQIWVAAGTYKPTSGTDRAISFIMKNGIAIYGGFPNTGDPAFGDRNPAVNVTTLSGDIGAAGNGDNSFHVIENDNNGLDDSAILDGFVVTGGNGTSGGGMHNSFSSPSVTNCIFTGNAAFNGGGMFNFFSSPTLTNCTFSGNLSDRFGGGMNNTFSSSPTITNCSFSGNVADNFIGGALYNNQSSSPILTNCIIWGNNTPISNAAGSNPIVAYSIVQGGYGGVGNLNLDPLFVNQPPMGLGTAGDLHLQACSPAKNAGTANGAPAFDFDGELRPQGAGVDMGFDENGAPCCPAGNVLYVKENATGTNTGNSWMNAFNSLQDALALAALCPGVTEIRVAAGTYKPTTGTNRLLSFVMKNNLAIYGGFPNTGDPGFTDRNWSANATILSGNINGPGNGDNSYHVIFNFMNGLDQTAILDGFIISGGNATLPPFPFGGGMFNREASPTVANCSFTGNSANFSGGGMQNITCSPVVANCSFSGNNAGNTGGGMHNVEAFTTMTNCSFSGNSAVNGGGGMGNITSAPTLTNCSFSGNSAVNGNGGGIHNLNATPTVINCILWGNSGEIFNNVNSNSTVSYSIVQGGYAGVGNLNLDPLFVSQPPIGLGTSGDLHLQACSPALDAGTASGAPATDLDGNARPFDAAPNLPANFDMGVYEYQSLLPTPVAACQSITVQLGADHTVSVSGSQVNNGSTGCGGLSFLLNGQTSLSFDCDDVGIPQNVTLTVTDYFANTATCSATITVADDDNPCCAPADAVCQNATLYLDENGEATLLVSDVDGGSTFECGLDEMTVSPSQFDCSHVGTIQSVTLTVTDVNGDSDECTADVTVQDNVAPVAICQNVTVQLDASGNGSTSAAAVNNGSSDACGIATLALSQSNFDCEEVGNQTVVLTVTDVNGNASTCSATVSVQDNVPPVAVCQNVTVQLDASGNGSTSAAAVNNGSSDACGIATLALSQTNFDCEEVGNQTVVLTVTDVNGNASTCSATVTVEDNVAPVAICQNVTVQLDASGNGSTSAAAVNNGSSDACGIATLALSQTNFDCEEVGNQAVELTVTDVNGNASTCSATVSVQDNIAPAAICQNLTVQLDASGNGSTSAAAVNNGSSDACGIATLALSQANFDCEEVGNQTVVLTVTDVNGNVGTCSATVSVQDNVAPVAICQNVTVQLDASGNGSTSAAAVNNGSSDACGIATLSLSQTNFDCEEVGNQAVELTVTDENGNASTCSAIVTVEDNVPPAAVCQNVTVQLDANGNGSTSAAAVNNGSSDACGISTLALSQTDFDCGDVGTVEVSLTVTDNNGNTSTCTADVTVEDDVDPLAICQDLTVELNAGTGDATILPQDVDDGSADACGIGSLSLDQTTFTCSDLGENSVTLTVTDNNGNTAACTATVTVEQYAFSASLPACQTVYFGYAPAACANINSSVSGGAAPFSYLWSNGATSANIQFCATSPASPPPFNVTVTDANGCTVAASPAASVEVVDVRCGNNLNKVKICHNGNNTNCVSPNAVPAHLAHGDYLGECGAPDPCGGSQAIVVVLHFNAQLSEQEHGLQVDLSWITNTGDADERYEIEKSADGAAFESIAEAPARNDSQTHLYRDTDHSPQEGTWFYRLKITRKDSSAGFSEPKLVNVELPADFTVFPNPASEQVRISLKSSAGKAADFQLVNAQGLVVAERHFDALPVEPVSLELDGVKDGLYWLNVQVEGQRSRSVKFVVARM